MKMTKIKAFSRFINKLTFMDCYPRLIITKDRGVHLSPMI